MMAARGLNNFIGPIVAISNNAMDVRDYVLLGSDSDGTTLIVQWMEKRIESFRVKFPCNETISHRTINKVNLSMTFWGHKLHRHVPSTIYGTMVSIDRNDDVSNNFEIE